MSEKIFHKKRVTRCGDLDENLLDRYTHLAIENNAIDDYAEGITDKEYLEMEQLEKQILYNQEKAEKWDKFNDECQGNLALSFKRTNELEQEIKQLKEELKVATTLLDNTSQTAGDLKQKLKNLKEFLEKEN